MIVPHHYIESLTPRSKHSPGKWQIVEVDDDLMYLHATGKSKVHQTLNPKP